VSITETSPIRFPSAETTTPPRRKRPEGRSTRVAVVGAGYIAAYHLEVLKELAGVEVHAVVDRDLDRARNLARRFDVEQALASLAELDSEEIDVAHVVVPPDQHTNVGRELLEKGISVLLEKPLALSSVDVALLAELAAEKGLLLAANHNALFHPAFQSILNRVRQGAIGRIEHVQATLSVPLRQLDAGDYTHWMFREPRNIVFEQAPHPFSQITVLIGAPKEVDVTLLGQRELNPGQAFVDRWLVAGKGERGTAELYMAFGQDFTQQSLRVIGTDGVLEADLHHSLFAEERKSKWLDFWNSFLAGWRRGADLRLSARKNLLDYLRQTLGLGRREDAFYAGMRGSIRAFHGAYRRGELPPAHADHARDVLAWCDACVADLPSYTPPAPLEAEARPARAREVCVLGATGFIGRKTLAALTAHDLPVTAICRRRSGLAPEIENGVRAGRIRFAEANLTDIDALRNAIRGAHTVVHLATGGGDTWEEVERAMVEGTRAFAEAALEEGVQRFIYVSSTAALYLGHDCGTELLEDSEACDPQPEKRPLYARGKIAAEKELLRLHNERGLPVTIVRPAVVVGHGTPLQHSGLGLWVRDNHCVGWGLGRRPTPLVLADDVADALARLVDHEGDELAGKCLNLSSRQPLTPPELIARLARETGRDFHFHPRPFWLSQLMEIGKWIVKRVGGRRDASFPSFRDLKSRSMYPALACRTARNVLGWTPNDDADDLLKAMLPPKTE